MKYSIETNKSPIRLIEFNEGGWETVLAHDVGPSFSLSENRSGKVEATIVPTNYLGFASRQKRK